MTSTAPPMPPRHAADGGEVIPARIFRDERNANRMSRSRVRVCLQDGLRLDLNRLARKGFIKFGTNIGLRGIAWTNSSMSFLHPVEGVMRAGQLVQKEIVSPPPSQHPAGL